MCMRRDSTWHGSAERRFYRQRDYWETLACMEGDLLACRDVQELVQVVLEYLTRHLGVDAANILLHNPQTQQMETVAARGFLSASGPQVPGKPSQCMVTAFGDKGLEKECFARYYALPLTASGQMLGVLELFQRVTLPPDPQWLDFLPILARQVSIALHHSACMLALHGTHKEMSRIASSPEAGWTQRLQLEADATPEHHHMVLMLTRAVAQALQVDTDDLAHIEQGVLLCRMSHLGLPHSMLQQPTPFRNVEPTLLGQHPIYATELLRTASFLQPALEVPYYQYERWDGTGYPCGLQGEEIPLAARIYTVVGVWDALCSVQPYRKAWTDAQVRHYLHQEAGKQFDPRIVEVLLHLLET